MDVEATKGLHAIEQARDSHGLIERLLELVASTRAEAVTSGAIGMPEIDLSRLELAEEKLWLVDVERVRAHVSDAAADALAAMRAALAGVDDAVSLTAGPDRTVEQARAASAALASAAEAAIPPFRDYWAAVGGLELPGVAAFVAAVTGERRNGAADPDRPRQARPLVPRVRLPLAGATTALHARRLAGRAYATVGLAYARHAGRDAEHAGMIALGTVSSLSGRCYVAWRIAERAASADAGFAAEAEGVGRDVDACRETIEPLVAGTVRSPPPARADAASGVTLALRECARSLAGRVRRIDGLAARAGYDLAPEGRGDPPGPPGP